MAEKALAAVGKQACVRALHALGRRSVKAMGMPGYSPNARSAACAPRSTSRCTKLAAASRSLTVAVGIDNGGRREVLGMGIAPSEAETFWISFLRKLARRSLSGVGMPAERRAAHYPLPQLPGPNRIVIRGTFRPLDVVVVGIWGSLI